MKDLLVSKAIETVFKKLTVNSILEKDGLHLTCSEVEVLNTKIGISVSEGDYSLMVISMIKKEGEKDHFGKFSPIFFITLVNSGKLCFTTFHDAFSSKSSEMVILYTHLLVVAEIIKMIQENIN